jgi:hypothetical protein
MALKIGTNWCCRVTAADSLLPTRLIRVKLSRSALRLLGLFSFLVL